MIDRRNALLALAALPGWAAAHHGWSSFDLERPLYLEGKAGRVRWQNPHAELELQVPTGLALPADLAGRSYPAQSAGVDGRALAARAAVPTRQDRSWQVELAPLTRLEAWRVPEIKTGTPLAVLGFTFNEEKSAAVLRAEYLYLQGRIYGLRSSPA